MKLAQGFVQLYTGNGKGKTTAAFGATLRAACHNYQVCFMQFLKGGHDAQSLSCISNVDYFCFGKNHETDGWYAPLGEGELPPQEIVDGWNQAKEIIQKSEYNLIVLDELNVALAFGFLDVNDVISTLQQKPLELEIIITGRKAPQELIQIADIATEMREVRHIFNSGIPARKGFDF
ncbi:TPA: cob(I)yrinic acid a,c-diamide adenosyltransferase [Candidatus Dependentiae bacterium]|nr:cob(I)yrinic acid a,c-diamide adenosyltransferase [Candidatus Dependentiae bacterium]